MAKTTYKIKNKKGEIFFVQLMDEEGYYIEYREIDGVYQEIDWPIFCERFGFDHDALYSQVVEVYEDLCPECNFYCKERFVDGICK